MNFYPTMKNIAAPFVFKKVELGTNCYKAYLLVGCIDCFVLPFPLHRLKLPSLSLLK